LPRHGVGEIAFYGGTFSALPLERQDAYLRIARTFVGQGRVAGIRVSTRPDALGVGQVKALVAGGVTTVEIGCQSFDDSVLSSSLRGHSVHDILEAVGACRAAGLTIGLQLMPGLPGASHGEALASLQAALALRPAFVRIYPTLVFKGTGLADLWKRGAFQPCGLEEAVDLGARQMLLCRAAAVPVIRLGIQSQEGLEKSILAGPYHPAFGQLVRSRLWRWALAAVVREHQVAFVHPGDLADALGHGRQNLAWLKHHRMLGGIRTDSTVYRDAFLCGGNLYPLQDAIKLGDQV
jgi:histone acetyltransferase (RNA polymerase elongator complex component)